jgi:hypothetical protein
LPDNDSSLNADASRTTIADLAAGSPGALASDMLGGKQGSVEEMANARGEVVETPTQEMPFKAVIFTEGQLLRERFFASRPEAEAYIVDTLKQLEKSPKKKRPKK